MRQLELDLTPDPGSLEPVEPWRYRFTSEALVEDLGENRSVYGLWEKLFGCWAVDTRTNASREFIPNWRFLNSNGVWHGVPLDRIDDPGVSASHFLSKRWFYEANAAFSGLLSGIPQSIRSVVASLDRYQWLALDMIWQQPEFAKFLDEEIYNGTQQFVFACFAASDAETFSRKRRSDLAVALMARRRTDLLSELSGFRCGKAVLRTLYKLGPEPCSTRVYLTVLNCMTDDNIAKAFSHTSAIRPETIDDLSIVPRELLLPNVARIVLSVDHGAGDLSLAIQFLQTVNGIFSCSPIELRERAIHSLGRARNVRDLLKWGVRWEGRLLEFSKYPPPPIDRCGPLAPLTTPETVRHEAIEMHNCAASLIPSILAEQSYLFHWDGDEPATVRIVRAGGSSWHFDEALGFDNAPLSSQTESTIRAFVEQGLRARPSRAVLGNNSQTDVE